MAQQDSYDQDIEGDDHVDDIDLGQPVAQPLTQDQLDSLSAYKDALTDKNNTISGTFHHHFKFDHANDAQPVTFNAEVIKKAFGGKVDGKQPVYLHSVEITGAHNTAPYSLGFSLTGVQDNKTIENVFKDDGTSYTAALAPGTSTEARTVYAMEYANHQDVLNVLDHGSDNLEEEMKNVTIYAKPEGKPLNEAEQAIKGYYAKKISEGNAEDQVAVPADSKLGELVAEKHYAVTGTMPFVNTMANGEKTLNSFYGVLSEVALNHQKNVVSKLPLTTLSKHTGTLLRLDHAQGQKLKLGDADSAPGLSEAGRSQLKKAKQEAWVQVKFNVLDPALFGGDV